MTSASVWQPAYIALGSNLDDPRYQVEVGFARLATLRCTRLVARSRLYASIPLGSVDQPDFVNAVAGVMTTLTPRELLVELKSLERELGRDRSTVRWGPRRIDFDLIVYAQVQVNEADLVVPHIGVQQRNFVLYPLCDIAPELVIPGVGVARELARGVGGTGLHVLA